MLGRMNKYLEGWRNIGNNEQMLGKSHRIKIQFKVLKINFGNHEQMLGMTSTFWKMNKCWEDWTNIGKDEQLLGITNKCWKKSQGQIANNGNYEQMLGKSHRVKMQFKVLNIYIGNHKQMLGMKTKFWNGEQKLGMMNNCSE